MDQENGLFYGTVPRILQVFGSPVGQGAESMSLSD